MRVVLEPYAAQTAVVTGASGGLGLALVRALAELAAPPQRVILTARDAEQAVRAAATLRAAPGLQCVEAYAAPLDVCDRRSIAAFAAWAERSLDGGVDLLFNNAAICPPGWNAHVVRQTLRTNVLGPLALSAAVLPGMLDRRRGHIVNVSSGDGELVYLHTALQRELHAATTPRAVLRVLARASPPQDAFGEAPAHSPTPAYSISKAALNALTRIAAPPETSGVRISAVCPGDVLTRMCTDEDTRASALLPDVAARDVVWLAASGLATDDGRVSVSTGRFWRNRRTISF